MTQDFSYSQFEKLMSVAFTLLAGNLINHQSCSLKIGLRNKFESWNVHGIMNTSDLLQSK